MSGGNFNIAGETAGEASRSFVGLVVGAGLLAAFVAAVLLCRLPHPAAPSLLSLLMRAAIYVGGAVCAGGIGIWLSLKSLRSALPASLVICGLAGVGAWVWVPAIVLLLDVRSPAAAVVAAVAGICLAAGSRKIVSRNSDHPRSGSARTSPHDLFIGNLQTPPVSPHGYTISLCIYGAAYAVRDHSLAMAAGLLAAAAFVFAWELTSPSGGKPHQSRRASRRPIALFLSALLITTWALIVGRAHRAISDATDVAFARGDDSSRSGVAKSSSKAGLGGYQSIILWPVPPKRQIIPPLPARTELLAPGVSRPLVIRFDGAYWYFQPPETRPGLHAHQAQGTPLSAHIRSNNSFPLSMEAHQKLTGAVRLNRCREIQVEIKSGADQPNPVALALLLGDSAAAGKPTINLGHQVLKTTLPDRPLANGDSSFETLRFEIPAHANIRKFDEITVMLLPDVDWEIVAPKIAVEQFQLFPR